MVKRSDLPLHQARQEVLFGIPARLNVQLNRSVKKEERMFKKIALFLSAACLIFSSSACRKSTTNTRLEEPEAAKKAVRVSIDFDIYNHTLGYLKSLTESALAGSAFRLRICDLGVSGVDERRIVVREGILGDRVAYSRTGECEFSVPAVDSAYSVFLMNASNRADYRAVDVRVGIYEGNLHFPREMKWSIENRDGFQGPAEPLDKAVQQLDAALDFAWARYGRFINVGKRQESCFTVGYGKCMDQYGWHTLDWAGVNPVHCYNHKLRMETFLEEIFELVTGTEDIAREDTVSLIADKATGRLNGVGRDLLAYIFVKDVM